MRNKAAIILIFCLATLGLSLLLSDVWLALRNSQYTELIQEFECGYPSEPSCKADFDGDGRLTQIVVRRRQDASVELPPRFAGNEQDVVLNGFSQDNTSRTHVAVRNASNGARLIIYDGTRWPGQTISVNAVYAWDGNKLSETTPAEADKEILSAMAARDDGGTFPQWVMYYLLAWPARLVYVSLFVVAALVYHRFRRTERMKPISV
jgi:hypothetical protein